MIKKSLYLALPLALSIVLSGCGDSVTESGNKDKVDIVTGKKDTTKTTDKKDTTQTKKISTAIFNATSNDVKILYTCGTQTGIVKDSGEFSFEEGKSCTFTYGNITQKIDASDLKEGVEIDEKPTTIENSELGVLLRGKTYYSVKPKDTRVIKLDFEKDQDEGSFYVTAYLDGASMSTVYNINDNKINIPSINLTLIFVKKEADYLLFDQNRRMYLDKTKAEEFIKANQ